MSLQLRNFWKASRVSGFVWDSMYHVNMRQEGAHQQRKKCINSQQTAPSNSTESKLWSKHKNLTLVLGGGGDMGPLDGGREWVFEGLPGDESSGGGGKSSSSLGGRAGRLSPCGDGGSRKST